MPSPIVSSPSAAIIGAGMAGLGAARTLQREGYSVTVFERASVPGGRVATFRLDDLVFDSGAQNIKSEGTVFEAEALEVLGAGDIVEISAPVCLHEGGKILPPDAAANAVRKWSCRGGLDRLAAAFAASLDIRYNISIENIGTEKERFTLFDKNKGALGEFESLICTLPAPQAAALIRNSDSRAGVSPERLALLEQVEYSPCIAVLLHFEAALKADWYALLARDRSHPLLWLARENAKQETPLQAGTSLIAQLGPVASTELRQVPDEIIIRQTCSWIGELLGDIFLMPQRAAIRRWPCAQSRNPAAFEAINPLGSRLVFCGDGVSAARVPDAYASGVRASNFLQTLN